MTMTQTGELKIGQGPISFRVMYQDLLASARSHLNIWPPGRGDGGRKVDYAIGFLMDQHGLVNQRILFEQTIFMTVRWRLLRGRNALGHDVTESPNQGRRQKQATRDDPGMPGSGTLSSVMLLG